LNFKRKTVKKVVQFEGLGLHTGQSVTMTLHPDNQGIRFRYGTDTVTAHPENVTDTTRSTKLGTIGTVEHIMSALAGLEITDVTIELTFPEIPGMDGSAKPFVDEINSIGTEEFDQAEITDLYSRLFLPDGDIKISIGKGSGHWRYEYETGDRWPGSQHFDCTNVIQQYSTEIAPARTFGLKEEIPHVLKLGLAQGLDADSAVILEDGQYMNPVRFQDEPARHKLLDLMGDLYLSGVPVKFLNVVGHRSGHKAQVEAAKMICKAIGREHKA
jgi:UDP-3-O-[3-hydroxymyristoyl] N-acetylglucosamine deacetylase